MTGQVPVVFFDEFDSGLDTFELGWLRYFLAPMQDGIFQSAQGPSRLGRCVFVFAGGTQHSYAGFLEKVNDPRLSSMKCPDFVSRLHGYLDMFGVGADSKGDAQILELLRRALLMRSFVERDARGLVDFYTARAWLDERLVSVLLTIPLKHGARSLESILRLSRPDEAGRLTLSSLPPSESLRAHVDSKDLDAAISRGVYR